MVRPTSYYHRLRQHRGDARYGWSGLQTGGGAKMVGQRGTHTLYKKWCVLTLTTIGFANTAGTHTLYLEADKFEYKGDIRLPYIGVKCGFSFRKTRFSTPSH